MAYMILQGSNGPYHTSGYAKSTQVKKVWHGKMAHVMQSPQQEDDLVMLSLSFSNDDTTIHHISKQFHPL